MSKYATIKITIEKPTNGSFDGKKCNQLWCVKITDYSCGGATMFCDTTLKKLFIRIKKAMYI